MPQVSAELIISAVQQPCNNNWLANQQLSIAAIHQAAEQHADLVILPELHQHSYFCQQQNPDNFDLAEPIPGPSTDTFAKLAAKLHIVIVTSLFEKRAPGLYHNTVVVLDKDGSIAGIYRKMHIPDDPGYNEKFYFTPGDIGFKPISTSIAKLGILICWDQWFPEAARLMTLAGAELLIYPTAIGWDPNDSPAEQQRQLQAWKIIQQAHAIANGMPVVVCNRVGFEPSSENSSGIEFWGNSFIADAQGDIICQANGSETTLLNCSIKRIQSEQTRRIWPFLRDRRITEYDGLLKRFID